MADSYGVLVFGVGPVRVRGVFSTTVVQAAETIRVGPQVIQVTRNASGGMRFDTIDGVRVIVDERGERVNL